MKTLITFVHYPRKKIWPYKGNLNFFLRKGLTTNEDHFFNIIINDPKSNIDIPAQKNLKKIQRQNVGYDFGAYKHSINEAGIENFERFIFINDTCKGPFLPNYIPNNISWVDLFLKDIDENVKLVGPSWFTQQKNVLRNCTHSKKVIRFLWRATKEGKRKHIQTYAFGTDKKGLELLIKNNIFKTEHLKKIDIITQSEVKASQVILENNFEIKPFQLSQNDQQQHCDIMKPGKYFGTTPHPLEFMFIKTNRIKNKTINNYTSWMK